MPEQAWLDCADPTPMLDLLRGKASERKLRLFAVACCRRIGHLLTDPPCRRAMEVAEQFADGRAGAEDLAVAFAVAQRGKPLFADANWAAAWVAAPAAIQAVEEGCSHAAQAIARTVAEAARARAWAAVRAGAPEEDRAAAWAGFEAANDAAVTAELREQAALLRELVGNPFRTVRGTASWRLAIVQLAQALYNGEDCSFALADALEEAGHVELAQHFRSEENHPKGCWAMDAVLGKS